MNYPKDLDEYDLTDLLDELESRRQDQQAGLCDYCRRKREDSPCKFPNRHSGKDILNAILHPNIFQDILEFHKAMCPEQINEKPTFNCTKKEIEILMLRASLIEEETDEMLEAIYNLRSLAKGELEHLDKKGVITVESLLTDIADGAVDSIVVIIGTLISLGISFDEIWREVHKTNMAKINGPVREDGKRLKPEGWVPPDIKGILSRQEPIKL